MQRALLSGAVSPTPALLSLATPGTNDAVVLICVTLSISGHAEIFIPFYIFTFTFFFLGFLSPNGHAASQLRTSRPLFKTIK